MNRMVGDFRALFEDAFGKKTAPSYARCKAAISQQAPTFYELLDLHRRLVENGPDGQGGGIESLVFPGLIQEGKGKGFS